MSEKQRVVTPPPLKLLGLGDLQPAEEKGKMRSQVNASMVNR